MVNQSDWVVHGLRDLTTLGDPYVLNLRAVDDDTLWVSSFHDGSGVVEVNSSAPLVDRLSHIGWRWAVDTSTEWGEIAADKGADPSSATWIEHTVAAEWPDLHGEVSNLLDESFPGVRWVVEELEPQGPLSVSEVEGYSPTFVQVADAPTISGVELMAMHGHGQGFYADGVLSQVADRSVSLIVQGRGEWTLPVDPSSLRILEPILVPGQVLRPHVWLSPDDVNGPSVVYSPGGTFPGECSPWDVQSNLVRICQRLEDCAPAPIGPQMSRWHAVDFDALSEHLLSMVSSVPAFGDPDWRLWENLSPFRGTLPPSDGWGEMLQVNSYWASALALMEVDVVKRWGANAQDFMTVVEHLTPDELASCLKLANGPKTYREPGNFAEMVHALRNRHG